MLPHEDPQERIVPVPVVSTELLLKQTADLDAEVTKHLKQIETGPPSPVATGTKILFLPIEPTGLFGLRRSKILDETGTQFIDVHRRWRSTVRYGEQRVAEPRGYVGGAHGIVPDGPGFQLRDELPKMQSV